LCSNIAVTNNLIIMILLEIKYTNLDNRKEISETIKTASSLKMKVIVSKLMDSNVFINDWTMTKKLPKTDRWGSDIDWTTGNKGINAGSYLHGEIEELV